MGMTRTPDEIKRELVTCLELVVPRRVQHEAIQHALALIQQLEADLEDMTARYKIADDCAKKKGEMNEKLYAELTAVKSERDAAVADMHEAQGCLCLICKNHKPDPEKKKYICKAFGDYPFEDGPLICWQFGWRGVTKEE